MQPCIVQAKLNSRCCPFWTLHCNSGATLLVKVFKCEGMHELNLYKATHDVQLRCQWFWPNFCMRMQECKACHELRLLNEYYRSATNKDGLVSKCKRCMAQSNQRKVSLHSTLQAWDLCIHFLLCVAGQERVSVLAAWLCV